MVIYGLGFAAVFALLAALNLYGYRCRRRLELDESECFLTRSEIRGHGITTAVALTAVSMTQAGVSMQACGLVYCLLGPLHFGHGQWTARRVAALRTRAVAAAPGA